MVQDFNMEVRRTMDRFVPMVTVRRRGGDAAWFDDDYRRAFELKQASYNLWCMNSTAVNWDLFCQARRTPIIDSLLLRNCHQNLDDRVSANAWWHML